MAETIIVGGREYTCHHMNAFSANKLLMRIQKIVLPVIGGALGNEAQSIGDIDVSQAIAMVSEHLDESVLDNIVLPMFAEAKVYDVERKKFIRTGADIDVCFTAETLVDFYELIWEVGRLQFGPFFAQIGERFGGLLGADSK
jgi:stage V sporulation protein SpoVS